ncbi:hypothetical protein THAOC_03328 [Thalassiosira oceanica]|uniref:HOOK N-terminal domain-containing protein n=1 Tax=Thalassiosira oceanica TaxID=159749 RepID=K0TL38_THAOC|nr:hypothetical protein THAOC_03328 [Thalassiosira oceanica]|eukprot:EJK74966.1 hypothetical protein THAOC_03328 [Thalassiosira oceanica]
MSSSSEIEEPHGTTVCEFFQNVFLSISKPPESLDDLCDGVAMFEALSEISMDHFDPSSFGRDFGPNWALKASNLKKLVRNLEDFYHDELSKDADFDSLSSRANEIAKGEDMDGLLEIVELVMVAATLCDDSPEAMAEMQDILQETMSTVTDFVEGGSHGEDDADSIMFEEGEEDKNISGEVLFPSHGDEELQKERDQLRQALQDANREIGHLKSQAAIESEENQKDKEKLRLLNQDLHDRLRKREDELSQAEQTISTNGRALDEATNEVHDLKEKSSSLADELDVEKSKVLNLSKKAAMVEVYRKKLDAIETSDSSGSTEQAENYIEQIMKLESANQKIPKLERDLDEAQTKAKKLEARIQEQIDHLATKESEISKFKSDALNAVKSKKMFEDELKELRAQQEGAADAAITLNGLSGASEAKLKSDNTRLRAQLEQMQQASSSSASALEGDSDKVSELKKELAAKEDEVSRLVNDKEKLEAYTKKTLQKFQDCKAKLREKHERIEALEMRSASEKVAAKREEKLVSSALYELGLTMMQNKMNVNR